MPIKSRMIEENLKQTVERNAQFQDELSIASSELEKVHQAVVKGMATTDTLVSAQTRVNVIEQTITALGLQIAALEADLTEQRRLELKRLTFQNIKLLDDEAEKIGSRFIKLYSEVESLNYARFAEMSLILLKIADLRSKFDTQIHVLIPDANKLKSRILPEVQSEFDTLLAELQTDCKLGVLRATALASEFSYIADDDYALRLPESDLSNWIWESIRIIRQREVQKHRDLPNAENSGLLSRIFSKSPSINLREDKLS